MREAEQTRVGPQAQASAEEFLFQNMTITRLGPPHAVTTEGNGRPRTWRC